MTFHFSRPFACFVGNARALANAGTWGLSALSRLGTSGLDFDNMPEDQKRIINNAPAILYHGLPRRSGDAKTGVNTESAVLMRMNAVPRSITTGMPADLSQEEKDNLPF